MFSGWPYALGTLLCWAGVIAAIVAIARIARLTLAAPDAVKALLRKQAVLAAAVAGVTLVISAPLLRGHEGGNFFLPVVWLVMPFAGWLAVFCWGAVVVRLLKLLVATGEEKVGYLKTVVSFGAVALVGMYFYKRDPSNTITLLKGAIPLSPSAAAGLVILALAATAAMSIAGQQARTRGYAKAAVAQIVLLVGSLLFGVPFLWLIITSFKEDVDMSSPNGLVWIPKVEETIPFMSKENPILEGQYKGQTVQGEIAKRNPDGTVELNITKPGAIAGRTLTAPLSSLKQVSTDAPLVWATYNGQKVKGVVADQSADGSDTIQVLEPASLKGQSFKELDANVDKIRHVGLKWQNYPTALDFMPLEANHGLTYLSNTLYLVLLSVIGTLMSSSIVAYAFSRMRFPGREPLFALMLSTMMLPAAVTMLPQFLIFRSLGWIDTLRPLWVPAFLGSAFNIFLLRQFLMGIPMELEDAAKIDGCTYLKTFWSVMLPQIKPALAVIGIWTFMGAWNNFMGPLIYVSSPEHMPISYALQMYNSDRGGEPGLLMAFTTLSMLPVLGLFFFAQRYFIEGVTLSGLGGR